MTTAHNVSISSERAIENLISSYAFLNDDADIAGIGELFADAVCTLDGTTAHGREGVETLARTAINIGGDGRSTTNHEITNIMIDIDEVGGTAIGRAYWTLYVPVSGAPANRFWPVATSTASSAEMDSGASPNGRRQPCGRQRPKPLPSSERTAMTLSADDEIEALRESLGEVNDPSVTPPVSEARSAQAAYGTAVPLPAGIERAPVTLGGVPTERLHPSGAKQQRAFLLLHSGGYSAGTAADHAALATQLALAADATGYVPEYRRAPEYPFPAAIDDAIDAYRGLLNSGLPSDKIVVAGDSTGGGMAIVVAQQAAVLGLPKPAGVYVISRLLPAPTSPCGSGRG